VEAVLQIATEVLPQKHKILVPIIAHSRAIKPVTYESGMRQNEAKPMMAITASLENNLSTVPNCK
jgi:hypothetical protein